jgi:hypothetical protein
VDGIVVIEGRRGSAQRRGHRRWRMDGGQQAVTVMASGLCGEDKEGQPVWWKSSGSSSQ